MVLLLPFSFPREFFLGYRLVEENPYNALVVLGGFPGFGDDVVTQLEKSGVLTIVETYAEAGVEGFYIF